MDIFEKLAEFSNETFSALKWIFLFISCVTFFALPFKMKPSKKDVSKAVTFSSAVSFAVTACGFVYADILDMVWKLIGSNHCWNTVCNSRVVFCGWLCMLF